MLDKVLAVISLTCLVAFVGVLVGFIAEIDLTIVVVVVLVMAAVDFFLILRPPPKSEEQTAEQDAPR